MPVYLYHCDSCGIEFEKYQKYSEKQLAQCPECGKLTLHKVFTPVGVIFKGSGFYSTDHRSASGMSAHAKEKKEEKAEKTETEKTETPSASKTEEAKSPAKTAKSS